MIRYAVDDGVATLTIDRPEKRNALTWALLGDFVEAVAQAGADDAVRVLVVTGAGGAFCAGTDLADLARVPAEERGGRGGDAPRGWPLVVCPKPVVAAIDGVAVGMGAEFTSQCDVRIASTRARFAWNFAHRGLVPDTGAGSWLLPRLVGHARALEWLYSGRFVSAEEAHAAGYVAQVVPADACLAAAQEVARGFLAGSPLSHRLMKSLVYEGLERGPAAHLAEHARALATCFASADHREGVAAFLEKRPARFTGK